MMPGAKDIRAGRAFVELFVKQDKLQAGLKAASARLKTYGAGVAKIGAGVLAAGSAITGALGAAVSQVLSTGDAFDKMRQRTGLSVKTISELDHAAAQSGASLEDVETGVRKMQKTLGDAANGSKSAAEAIADLGLSASALEKMNPEEQFDTIAKKIGGIQDPTKRAAAAMSIFGKSGTKLLPMIEDMDALREEAERMGFTMSGETAAGAVKLGDMIALLGKSVKQIGIDIGAALIQPLIKFVGVIQPVLTKIVFWVKESQELVKTISAVGVAVTVAGGSLLAFGTTLAIAGVALGGLATALGVVLSPVVLITGALTAGVAAWALYTESGQSAVTEITASLGALGEFATKVFGGIVDALASGQLALAGQIAMAGLQSVWAAGVAGLSETWEGFKAFFLEVANQATSGLAETFIKTWYKVQEIWIQAKDFFADLWDTIVAGAVKAWRSAQNVTGQGFLDILGKLGILDEAALKDAKGMLAKDTVGRNPGTDAERNKSIANREQRRNQDLAGIDAERKGALGAIAGDRTRRSDQIESNRRKNISAADAAAADAQAELDRLLADADKARQEKEKRDQQLKDKLPQKPPAFDEARGAVAGAFTASAAIALGGGKNRTAEEQLATTKESLRSLNRIEFALREFGTVR